VSGEEYLITHGKFGESILEVLHLSDTYKGVYVCEAYNTIQISQIPIFEQEDSLYSAENKISDEIEESVDTVSFVVTDIIPGNCSM